MENSFTTLTLYEGFTTIDGKAFTNNSKLTTIYLPSTLTNVGAEAFWRLGPNKDRTTTVYFAGTRQQLENLSPSAWL